MDEVKTFDININGEIKKVELDVRLRIEEANLEFGYFHIVEPNDTENTEKLLYAFLIKSNGETDEIIPIELEEQRKLAFEVYQKAYNRAINEKNIKVIK